MIPEELIVLLNGERAGLLRQKSPDTLSFRYDDAWRTRTDSYPLSLSLPLLEQVHEGPPIRAYLQGLLPDKESVLESWAKAYHVSKNNPYALLSVFGEDCPGAVQFISNNHRTSREPGLSSDQWLNEGDIARLLRNAVQMYSTGTRSPAGGYFSLAGAQPKIALYRDGERWSQTSDRRASTVLLKPQAMDLDHIPLNEHLCMMLATELGIRTAGTELRQFEDQVALVVDRFDRMKVDGSVQRIHQEDFCQALGLPPSLRYENEGGPGAARCCQVLIEHAADPDTDLPTFIDALALNWLILGTDAHAKNYAFLYYSPKPSLAPLYDIISVLPYEREINSRQALLAMRIGGEYRPRQVMRRHWARLAREIQIDEQPVIERVRSVINDVPAAANRVREHAAIQGLDDAFTEKLLGAITREVPVRLRGLDTGPV